MNLTSRNDLVSCRAQQLCFLIDVHPCRCVVDIKISLTLIVVGNQPKHTVNPKQSTTYISIYWWFKQDFESLNICVFVTAKFSFYWLKKG